MTDPTISRIVSRYASSVAIDPKMQVLLLKLRKGADASLSLSMLMKVLALLGGWRVEKFVGLVQMHGYGGKDADKPALLYNNSEEAARTAYAKLERQSVTMLPSDPKSGEDYIMDLSPFRSWAAAGTDKYHGADYRAWRGADGYKFTDPHGKVFEMLPGKYDLRDNVDPKILAKKLPMHHLMPWIKKETSYLAQINEVLGVEEHVPAAKRMRDNTGTCAVCFRNIKLVARGDSYVMALHGYNRPGHGYVVGRCWGGDHPPYELSCVATERILKAVQERLEYRETYLKSLSSPALTEFNEHKWWGGTASTKIVTKEETSANMWAYHLKQHVEATEMQVDMTTRERNIYKWLIDNWNVRELPTEGAKEIDWFEVAQKSSR